MALREWLNMWRFEQTLIGYEMTLSTGKNRRCPCFRCYGLHLSGACSNQLKEVNKVALCGSVHLLLCSEYLRTKPSHPSRCDLANSLSWWIPSGVRSRKILALPFAVLLRGFTVAARYVRRDIALSESRKRKRMTINRYCSNHFTCLTAVLTSAF